MSWFTPAPRPNETPRMKDDQRGAVMLIGIFMACFLIGALWSVVGLGDALVYRDKVQEAADHTAFSSATVHARGMNFMAALNLVMLAIAAIWVVIDLIDKALLAINLASDAVCASGLLLDPLAIIACPIATASGDMYATWHEWDTAYKDGMEPVLIGLSWTQTLDAMAAPYGGLAAGAMVASDYGESGISLSMSMIPSFALTGGLTNGSYGFGSISPTPPANAGGGSFKLNGIDARIGLPVTNETMNKLCMYSVDFAASWVESWLKKIPIIGGVFDLPGVSTTINSILAGAVTMGSCNEYLDSFWGRDGPKRPYYGNGSDWHQVFGVVFPGTYKDVSQSKIAMSVGPKMGMTMPPIDPDGSFYIGQAEFYYDCDAKWTDDGCNGSWGMTTIPRAMYSMRWMARLRRVHYPSLSGMFMQWLGGMLTSANVLGPLKGKIATSGWYQKIGQITKDLATKFGGKVGSVIAKKLFGDLANNVSPDGNIIATGNGGGIADVGLGYLKGLIPGITNPPATGMVH